jgi:hypothetical protein
MEQVTTVFECETCWARADTPEAIEHRPVIRHPEKPRIVSYSFPLVREPAPPRGARSY